MIWRRLLFCWLILTGSSAAAAEWTLFYGFGTNFAPGEAIRVGANGIEVGMLADQAIGVVKNFGRNRVYGSLGLSTNGLSLGPFAAMGFHWPLFWRLHLRGELYAYSYVSGMARGRGLLGLHFNF